MIQMIRIDDRLLHGQVAYSWKSALGYQAIIIACDRAANDNVRKTALKLCTPDGVKLAVRTIDAAAEMLRNPKLDATKVFVICEKPADVQMLLEKIDEKPLINLGGMQKRENTEAFSKAVFLGEADLAALDEISDRGYKIEVRQVPSNTAAAYETLRKKSK